MWGGFIFSWDFAKTSAFNTIGSINTFGIFSAVVLAMLSALLFVVKRPGIKIFFGLFALLNIITLVSINFWTLWIILAAGMFIVLLFSLMYVSKLGKGVNWIALPMVLLGISLIFIFFRPTLSFKPALATEVGLNYRGSFSVISSALKERPILGSGPEMFSFDYAKYKPSTINETAFWNVKFSNPSGEIYSVVSGFGILGALSFLVILVLFIINAIKNITREKEEDILKKFLDVSILAGWFGILVSWFLYPQSITLTFVFWLLFALYLIDNSTKEETVYSLRKTPKVLLISSLCFVVAIVIIIGMLYVAGTRYVADIMYARGVNLVQVKGEIDNGINAIVKSTVVNPYDDNNYKALSQLFTIKLQQDAANTELKKEEVASLVQADAINAINSATRTTVLSPKDASNWLLRGQVYRGLISVIDGAADWAETSYNEAIKLEASNPFAYLELGRLYTNKADLIVEQARKDEAIRKTWDEYIAKAMEYINKSIELKSNYSEAYFEQAQVYDREGKLAEAIKGMEINRQLLPDDSSVAFQLAVLYYRSEMFKEAQAEFIRAIGIDTNFSNARYFLGLLYDWQGNKAAALEQFNKIAELNKDNKEIQTIISNINAGKPALGKPISAKKPSELLIDQQPVNQ
jgi:tetratricopeptide (TPR) repeat protein